MKVAQPVADVISCVESITKLLQQLDDVNGISAGLWP